MNIFKPFSSHQNSHEGVTLQQDRRLTLYDVHGFCALQYKHTLKSPFPYG
jgi:hypothetical protein